MTDARHDNTDPTWAQIENPVTHERMVFLDRSASRLEVQFDLPPGSAGSPPHVHRRMHETFEVSSGALEMTVGHEAPRLVRPGELVTILPGTPHSFRNPTKDWVTFSSVVRPPGQFEKFLRAWYGLAQAGLVDARGMPKNLLHLALGLHYADFTIAGIPGWVQRPILASLVRLARLVGAEKTLRAHLASEGQSEARSPSGSSNS